MKTKFPPEWRTQSRWKRRLYARYMTWLERLGYAVVTLVICAFVFAFNYRVDETVSAENVTITAAATPMIAVERTLVVRQLVPNYSDVEVGQPVFEIVSGDREVDQYLAWRALENLGSIASISKPPILTIGATASGVLVADPETLDQPVDASTELAQIRNYRDLRLRPTLTGQGVANAVAGGVATIRAISVEAAAGVVLRGNVSGKGLVSGQLVPEETRDAIQRLLADTPLTVRDDLPLKVMELSDLQVDADLALASSSGGSSTYVEAPPSTTLKADVLSGVQVATVQFATLPPAIQKEVNSLLAQAIENRHVTALDGTQRNIVRVENLNTVFKAKATPAGANAVAKGVPGTAVSRGFEAELRIQSPPDHLVAAVRRADAAGRSVKAKVELKTGDRVIATLLLKRS